MLSPIMAAVVLTSSAAYFQSNKNNFLIFNILTIILIAYSFFIHNAMFGFWIEISMFFINLLAFFIQDKYLNYFKIILSIISFIIIFSLNLSVYNLFMSAAISFFIIAIYQKNMKYNKLFFIFGLLSMSIYSVLIKDNNILVMSIIGILINLYKFLELRNKSNS